MEIFFRKLALTFVIATSTIFPASAQTYVAVIWGTESVHYFASPGDTSYLGDTESGMHLCAASQAIIYNNSRYAEFFLPNGRPIYTFWTWAAGAFTLDPANDKKCQENAGLYAQQSNPRYAHIATSQSPGVYSKPVAPNYGGSGAGATTFIDDAMREDLKEVLAPNSTQAYPHGMSDILAIPNLVSLRAETVGNYFLWRNHDSGNNQGIHWSSDKDMQDFVKARRWYQFSLDRQTIPAMKDHLVKDIEMCNYALSNKGDSARSQIAKEKRKEQVAAEENQKRLNARKKVGDCVVIPGGTGFLGLASTIGTVTGVSGDTISWMAHLHRNGHWAPAIAGGSYYVAPQDFDREGSAKYNEVSTCD